MLVAFKDGSFKVFAEAYLDGSFQVFVGSRALGDGLEGERTQVLAKRMDELVAKKLGGG
jgi:hypothetical protein